MKYLLLTALLIFSSCSLLERGPVYKPYADRLNECIKSYLMMDIKPEQAVNICTAIHGKRE